MPQGHSCGFFMARSVKSVRTFKSQESLEIDDSDMSWKNKFSPAHGKRDEFQGLAAEMLERSRSPFRVMVYSENRICDDRQEYPSLDGTNSSASLECSSEYSESEGPCSPQEGSRSNVLNFEAKLRERGSPLGWSAPKSEEKPPDTVPRKPSSGRGTYMWEEKREKRQTAISEVEMMKERFARLLLGEDMSGGRKGVSTALAISNAITNLSASVFGEFRRLEPLPSERKTQWKREMEWLLSVTDHIVELKPTWQKYPNGTSVEVMVSSPRPDLHINLPALRKLDTMLLECLDGFEKTEFWYVDQGVAISDTDEQSNLSNSLPRQEEKWWLPSPRVPASGLCEDSKRRLQQQRESINQVLKAAMAINAQILSEMEVPDVYWEALPKNGRSSLGEMIYHNLISDHFSPEMILGSFDLSTEHNALDLANRIEAAIHAWRRKNQNRKETLIERAETLLLCLKLKFPGLPQTLLDIHKLQYNKDVGQSILESYSRVLESLAYNIIARIDDVLYADEQAKEANQGWSYAWQPRASNPARLWSSSTHSYEPSLGFGQMVSV